MKTLFYTHIPKCGGNGIRNILNNIGYREHHICNSKHGHKSNTIENYLITQKGSYPNKDIMCEMAVKNIKNGKVINTLIHHVFPRKKQDGDYIIASIRNPYDLMVSRWKYHCKFYPNQYTFEEWVNKYSGEILMRFFEQCYENGDCNRKMIIDYFIRLEYIEEDITNLIRLGHLQTNRNNEYIKKICSVKKNSTTHHHFDYYYNDDLKKKVYESSKLIFDMFGYNK